jgi:uncharacterized protein YggE
MVLVACGAGRSSSSTSTPVATSTTITAQTPPPKQDAPTANAQRSIAVTAVGRAHGLPDSVTITLAVETFAATTVEVLGVLSEKSTALTDYLKGAGVAAEDLQSTSLSAYPMYGNFDPGTAPAITGYQASVTVNVRSADLAAASVLVDGAVVAVGDALRIQGLNWSLGDNEAVLAEARADGVAKAKVQAEQLARASGLRLGGIMSVAAPSDPNSYMSSGYGPEGIPFNPGTQEMQVAVTVTFAADAA